MDISCNFSFWDLYKAAFKKNPSKKLKKDFQNLSQIEINKHVLIWAKKAGWQTEERIGSDKKIYLAFFP